MSDLRSVAQLFCKAYAAFPAWKLWLYVDACPSLGSRLISAEAIEAALASDTWTDEFVEAMRTIETPASFRDIINSSLSDRDSLTVFALSIAEKAIYAD